MIEEEKQAAGADVGTDAGEDTSAASPAKEEKPQTASESDEETTRSQSPASDGDGEDKSKEEDEKPSRAERRVHQLLDKLKGAGQSGREQEGGQDSQTAADSRSQEQLPPWMKEEVRKESIFKPGTEVTPDQLEQELNRRAAQIADLRVKQHLSAFEQRQQLTRTIEDHALDLERLQEEAKDFDDPTFDKAFTDLYQSINTDGNGRFVAKKKPREVYQLLKDQREVARTKGQSESAVKMAESMGQSAVSPQAGGQDRADSKLEASRQQAMKEGTTEAWAAYLKQLNRSDKKAS